MLLLLTITSPRNYGSTLPATLYSALSPGFGLTIVNSPINSASLTGLSRGPDSCEAPGGHCRGPGQAEILFGVVSIVVNVNYNRESGWGGLPFLILKMETARFREVGRPATSHIAGKQRNSLSYQAEGPHSTPLSPCWQWESSCLMPLREVLLLLCICPMAGPGAQSPCDLQNRSMEEWGHQIHREREMRPDQS